MSSSEDAGKQAGGFSRGEYSRGGRGVVSRGGSGQPGRISRSVQPGRIDGSWQQPHSHMPGCSELRSLGAAWKLKQPVAPGSAQDRGKLVLWSWAAGSIEAGAPVEQTRA